MGEDIKSDNVKPGGLYDHFSHPPKCENITVNYVHDHIAHVEMDRQSKMNAFNKQMWLDLRTIFDFLSLDPRTRAIILSGAGPKAFTAGLDVQEIASSPMFDPPNFRPHPSGKTSSQPLDNARIALHMRRYIDEFQACITAVEKCTKPVIAAMHGWCLALAIDIALAADVRICAKDTRFAVKEVDIGLAADIGTLSRMPKVVGNGSWVKDVCLSAREFGSQEALQHGLVSWVGNQAGKEEVLAEARRWAEVVALKSPVAVQGTKEILNWSWDRSVEDGLRYTSVWNSVALQSDDSKEAMRAWAKKKRPNFSLL